MSKRLYFVIDSISTSINTPVSKITNVQFNSNPYGDIITMRLVTSKQISLKEAGVFIESFKKNFSVDFEYVLTQEKIVIMRYSFPIRK